MNTQDNINKTYPQNPKPKQDSSTEVNTVFSGPRVVFGARVNKNLKERFVEAAKREYGSVCRLQEALMAAVLAVTPLKVNSSKTITIEKIVIERNLRPRRYARASDVEPNANYYRADLGVWLHVDGEPLNEYGHVAYCECLLCSGRKRR